MKQGRYRPTDHDPLKVMYTCSVCGSVVMDTDTHDAWHKSINMIASDFYGVDTEID